MQHDQTKPLNISLKFFSDPGHGWLQAPHSLIIELGIQKDISPYSYVDDTHAYLEEDCDYSVFKQAAEAKGLTLQLSEITSGEESPIRDKPSFNAGNMPAASDFLNLTLFVNYQFTKRPPTDADVSEEEEAFVSSDTLNCHVAAGNAREEVILRIGEEVERQQKYGWLQDKTFLGVCVTDVTLNTKDGRYLNFPIAGIDEWWCTQSADNEIV